MKIIYVIVNRYSKELEIAYDNLQDATNHVMKDQNLYGYEQVVLEETTDKPVEMKSIKDVEKKVYDPLHFNDVMPYGKYKGQTVGTIIQSDPEYLQWCKDNCNLSLDEDCNGLIEASLEK